MSEMLNILSELKSKNLILALDSDGVNLKLKGDLSTLTAELEEKIKSCKSELIEFFKENAHRPLTRIPQTEHVREFTLAPNQKGIWFHEKLENLGTAYIIPTICSFEIRNFSLEHFEKSLRHLVAAHDALRLVFDEKEGIPYQAVSDRVELPDHYSWVEVENKTQLQEKIDAKSKEVFSYAQRPLWDITIYQLPDAQIYFYLRIHHLIGDGESLKLFIDQLIQGYLVSENGGEISAASVLSYGDYVSWISEKDNFKNSSAFWKREFQDYEEDFHLTWAEDISAETSEQTGAVYIRKLGRDQTAQLRDYSQKSRVGLAAVYTASAGLVLSKRGRSEDFVIGIPTASRNHHQLSGIIGNFVNVLPLRLQIDYSLDARHYLEHIQQQYISLLDHQLYPFEYILDDIDYVRKADKTPLFNVMVSVPNNSEREDSSNEIEIRRSVSLYDLTLTFIEGSEDTELAIEYSTSQFTGETIETISIEISKVLDQLLKNTIGCLADITLLTEAVHEDSLQPESLEIKSVLSLLKERTEKTPEAIAVISSSESSSYEKLYTSAILLSNYLLQHLKIEKNSTVAVRLKKTVESVAVMYAVWLSDCVYVPVDTTMPDERVKLILEDCEPSVVIDRNFLEKYETAVQQESISITEPVTGADFSSTAYLLYTSGTTGRPKGVMISHGNLTNKMDEVKELLQIDETSVTYALTNTGFDVAFLETVLVLSYGGKVIIPGKEEIIDLLIKHKVTHLQGTPTYFTHFLTLLNTAEGKTLDDLKYLCIGGESLNGHLVEQLKAHLPNGRINNHYGPTEITIDAIVNESIEQFTANNIGRPIGNTEAYVVDGSGNRLPDGVVGELIIGGPSVFKGYWKDEILSQKKLKTVKFKNGTYYYTGDLARRTKAGTFEFFGRKDRQIKLRGYRIELEDINQTLLRIAGVDQAYSSVIEGMLVSWVISAKEEKELIETLRLTVPEYMVPQNITVLESFPLTENGKLAAHKLPKPGNLQKEYTAPGTAIETRIVSQWESLLEHCRVGIYDLFYELGGHSLFVLQLVKKLANEFRISISVNDIYTHPTVFTQASMISSKLKTGTSSFSLTKAETNHTFYPVSDGQRRILILSQDDEVSRSYMIPELTVFKGDFTPEKIKEALISVINRYEILRTVFVMNQDDFVQKITGAEDFDLQMKVIDLKGQTDQHEKINQYKNKDLQLGFNFETGPLMRSALFLLDENEFCLYVNIHHVICDGWSLEVLFQKIADHLQNRKIDESSENAAGSLQYKDYAVWQRSAKETLEYRLAKNFWTDKFKSEIPIIDFPTKEARKNIKTIDGFKWKLVVPKTFTRSLEILAMEEHISVQSILFSAFSYTLGQYSGQKELVVGNLVNGRIHIDLYDQIGFFVNSLPIRMEWNESQSFQMLCTETHKEYIEALKHQIYTLDALLMDVEVPRDLSRNPLFDVVFNYQEWTKSDIEFNDSSFLTPVMEVGNTVKFDIQLTITKNQDMLFIELDANEALMDQEFMKQYLMHFVQFVENAVAAPSLPLKDIEILSGEEKREMIEMLNKDYVNAPFLGFNEMFEAQVVNQNMIPG